MYVMKDDSAFKGNPL